MNPAVRIEPVGLGNRVVVEKNQVLPAGDGGSVVARDGKTLVDFMREDPDPVFVPRQDFNGVVGGCVIDNDEFVVEADWSG